MPKVKESRHFIPACLPPARRDCVSLCPQRTGKRVIENPSGFGYQSVAEGVQQL